MINRISEYFGKTTPNFFIKILLYGILAFFSYKLLLLTVVYIKFPLDTDIAFLRIKQQYIEVTHWLVAFFVHVFTSIFVLFAGFTQFSQTIQRKYPKVHRWMGYAYIINVVFVTGPASFIMACYANGHLPSRLAFSILAILWIGTTAAAWYYVVKRNWTLHRDFMIRSYALTLSAVTLRAWKWVLVALFQPRPLDVYMLVAWLGFVPNLIIAEIIIRKFLKK